MSHNMIIFFLLNLSASCPPHIFAGKNINVRFSILNVWFFPFNVRFFRFLERSADMQCPVVKRIMLARQEVP